MSFVFGAVGLMCLLLAGILWSEHRRLRTLSKRALSWPSVEAEIIESTGKSVLGWHDAETGRVLLWEWQLRYSYSWQGTRREGARFWFGDPVRTRTKRGLRKYLDAFRPGARTNVSVNPANPDEAVIRPEAGSAMRPLLIAILATGGIALLGAPLLLALVNGEARP